MREFAVYIKAIVTKKVEVKGCNTEKGQDNAFWLVSEELENIGYEVEKIEMLDYVELE